MNQRVELSQLERHVGLSIISVRVELFVFEDSAEPIGVMMQLSNEFRFVFFCSGMGKISNRRNTEFVIQADCRLAFVKEFAGEILKSVQAIENQLILRTSNHEMSIVNDDDDLVLYIDGNQVPFSSESESKKNYDGKAGWRIRRSRFSR